MKILNFLRKPTATQVRLRQIAEAELNALAFEARAEEQQAMADMYRKRAKRLIASIESVEIEAHAPLPSMLAGDFRSGGKFVDTETL